MKRTLIVFAALLQQLTLQAQGHGRPVTATVYHEWYHGRTTYCGQTFQFWGVSAAHPWLPCGTKVRVTRGSRVLTVPITDRCDCMIDLSAGAAHRLGVPIDGIGSVHITY